METLKSELLEKELETIISTEIVDRMKEIRESQELSRGDLSKLTGIHRPNIAHIENRSRGFAPSLKTVMRLLRPMGYTVEIVPIKEQ